MDECVRARETIGEPIVGVDKLGGDLCVLCVCGELSPSGCFLRLVNVGVDCHERLR